MKEAKDLLSTLDAVDNLLKVYRFEGTWEGTAFSALFIKLPYVCRS